MAATVSVRELNPSNSKAVEEYLDLEHHLAKGPPLYVAPTRSDLHKQLSGKSAFFEQIDHTLFVASDGEHDVAHCAALVNRRWQASHRDTTTGFIGYFGAAEGAGQQVRALLRAAEEWLADRGIRRAIAPFNGAAFLGVGAQVDAFDESPMFPFHWTPPHHAALLQAAAYEPSHGLINYWVDFSDDRYRERTRSIDTSTVDIRPVNKRRWSSELELLRDLLNDSFRDMWQFHQHTQSEIAEVFGAMKPILDPRQMIFAEVNGSPAGFAIGFPDLTPLFRSFDGKFGPLQLVRLMLGAKHYDRAGLLGIGVRDKYKGTGVARALAARIFRRHEELGFPGAFYYPVVDDNQRSRRFAESLGGQGRLVYRYFEKRLA